VIEHEVEVLALYADRIIVMDGGKVIMNGTPAEIFSQVEKLNALGLRVPEATDLAHRLGKQKLWKGALPTTTEEAVGALNSLLGVKA